MTSATSEVEESSDSRGSEIDGRTWRMDLDGLTLSCARST
jgi:hypothetical protein